MKNLPLSSGVCLKPPHFAEILANPPFVEWFEVHPENYMSPGGLHHDYLEKIRQNHGLSLHGVGMSLGSHCGIDASHLAKLKILVDRYEPEQVSEHLAWSHWNAIFLNDLLPLPYTHESLNTLCENIDLVQNTLQRQILIENPSVYLAFSEAEFTEPEFLKSLCQRSGCGLLMDVNNIAVSCFNNALSTTDYVQALPFDFIQEVHLAGHKTLPLVDNKTIRIDDHGSRVSEEVWGLLAQLLGHTQRALPLLIEWDTDIPAFSVLLEEANRAQSQMQGILDAQCQETSKC